MQRQRVLELNELVQAEGGLFSSIHSIPLGGDEPRFTLNVARSGNLMHLKENIQAHGGKVRPISLPGSGADLDAAGSLIPALAEGLERYCTVMFREEQFLSATAQELGDQALDLDTIARCSEAELSDPKCPLSRPTKSESIRWVKGLCLHTGQTKWIPAVLVYLYLKPLSRAESICVQITTGCAAHRTYQQALLGGILEVVERDAISLVWLQKLPLARIEMVEIPERLKPYWNRYQEASRNLECFFFDATLDLGIPTIYGVQRSSVDRRLSTIVCCASALDPVEAIIKVIRDMASTRHYLRHATPAPERWSDFTELSHGASWMARTEQREAFDFLTDSPARILLDQIPSICASDATRALRLVLDRFRKKQMEVYAVDLTSDEALRTGMRVVKAVIPALQPFSFQYRARYLGHRRLYDAPRSMGFPVLAEAELNQWPQPFA